MRLEYLATGSEYCPLVRLFDFSADEAACLLAVIQDLAAGRVDRVAVHALPGSSSVNGCEMILVLAPRDQGVAQNGEQKFECILNSSSWENVVGLIEPFAHDSKGFQWLARSTGRIAWLLSRSGEW